MHYDVVIAGGGAAGFFTAINLAERCPNMKVVILERGSEVLGKVRVSGGGRCNVTHAEFLPRPLSANYPRGQRELLGPFHRFMTGDTVGWFEERGVALKIEDDGRIFPTSDSSETIIDCFLAEAEKYGVTIMKQEAVRDIVLVDGIWEVVTKSKKINAKTLVLATGSNPKIWKLLAALGHTITEPVPSLFTFNIDDARIAALPGVATGAHVQLLDRDGAILKDARGARADRGGATGPLLITHWGMSGPAILKLSAWCARELHGLAYAFQIRVNWLPTFEVDEVTAQLNALNKSKAKKQVTTEKEFGLPKRLWQSILLGAGIAAETRWADLNKKNLLQITEQLTRAVFEVKGKSTFKEEFVTAGGIDLKEVDFKSFRSKKLEQLYFVGEILDIDAVTGGFNFQNAWTGGFVVANAIAETGRGALK